MLGAAARQTSIEVRQRPAARILSLLVSRTNERGVHEHRQRMLLLAGGRDGLGVAREVPGHEDLLAGRPRAEDLAPRAARLAAGAAPDRAQLRSELFLVGREVGQQLGGNRRAEGALGPGAVVARGRDHPDLVLHLDHHDGVRGPVDVAEVLLDRGERPGVGVAVLGRERRQDLLPHAFEVGGAGEPLRVALHPAGRVAGHAVLPRGEPEQHEPHPVGARLLDQPVERREVEPPLVRLDQVPVDGSQHRVHVELGEPGPETFEVGGVRSRGVAELAASNQERLPVHDQLGGGALSAEVGYRRVRAARRWRGDQHDEPDRPEDSHAGLPSSCRGLEGEPRRDAPCLLPARRGRA